MVNAEIRKYETRERYIKKDILLKTEDLYSTLDFQTKSCIGFILFVNVVTLSIA